MTNNTEQHDPAEMWQPIGLQGTESGSAERFPPKDFVRAVSHVDGIEVFMPAPVVEKRPDVVDFKCPKCGATIGYSVQQSGLACEYCGYSEAIDGQRLGRQAEQFEFRVDTLERAQKGWGSERKVMACQRCGGEVSTPADAIAYSCPFCGSNKVIFREALEDILRPRYLIPFAVDPAGCREITRKWLGASWMIPGQLREAVRENSRMVGAFHPLYIPFWTFQARANAAWRALVAHETREVYYVNGERKERTKTTWREESGKVEKDFHDLLVPGTGRLNMKTLGQIEPFDIQGLVLYEPRYLAGMQAQAYDIPLEAAWDAGRKVMRDRTRRACLDRASSSQVRSFTMTLDFNDESWRYILTPVYTSVYTFRDETYQILVNGQTGKIAGPRPVDWQKFWLVVTGILSPGAVVSLLGLLFSRSEAGTITLLMGLFLLVVGAVIAFFLFRQAEEMENG